MDCLLKYHFSFALKSVIHKIITEKNNYSTIVKTDEWSLARHLDSQIQNRSVCERACLGCVEFSKISGMFQNLTHGVVAANKEHKALIDNLCDTFGIEENDPIALALDLTAAPEYVKSSIPNGYVSEYNEYSILISDTFRKLALDYYLHEQDKYSAAVLRHANLENEQSISYTPLEAEPHQELFYLDQNIISKCTEDKNLKTQVINFREKSDCKLLYSPYTIEDGIKMSRIRLAEYFNAIKEITNLSMLVMTRGNVTLVTEDMKITSGRVILWRDATRAAENLKVSKMHYNYWGYPHYSRNSRVSKAANKDIRAFLDSFRPYFYTESVDIDFDDYESDLAIYHRLNSATIGKPFSFDELITRSLSFNTEAECVELIESLCELLDLINYKTEPLTDPAKIRSSLQDVEHLKCAWKADYFVTEDSRLRARGEFIYSLLKLKTIFIDLAEFKGKIIAKFKGGT